MTSLIVQASGRLTKEGYAKFLPQIDDRLLTEQGMVSALFDMPDFQGSELAPARVDTKFRDINRLAIVGDKKWQRAILVFCKPFSMLRHP